MLYISMKACKGTAPLLESGKHHQIHATVFVSDKKFSYPNLDFLRVKTFIGCYTSTLSVLMTSSYMWGSS